MQEPKISMRIVYLVICFKLQRKISYFERKLNMVKNANKINSSSNTLVAMVTIWFVMTTKHIPCVNLVPPTSIDLLK